MSNICTVYWNASRDGRDGSRVISSREALYRLFGQRWANCVMVKTCTGRIVPYKVAPDRVCTTPIKWPTLSRSNQSPISKSPISYSASTGSKM